MQWRACNSHRPSAFYLSGITVRLDAHHRCQRREPRTTTTTPRALRTRNLFDLAIGDDNLFKGDRYKWSVQVKFINITNNYALYNYLSTFSGTHYVSPRTALSLQLTASIEHFVSIATHAPQQVTMGGVVTKGMGCVSADGQTAGFHF